MGRLPFLLFTLVVLSIARDNDECLCVHPSQNIDPVINNKIYFQNPTRGGIFEGMPCSMNCTFSATLDMDGNDYYLKVHLASNSLGDGIISIQGLEDNVTIFSETPIGDVRSKSIGHRIILELTESGDNQGEFVIYVLKIFIPGSSTTPDMDFDDVLNIITPCIFFVIFILGAYLISVVIHKKSSVEIEMREYVDRTIEAAATTNDTDQITQNTDFSSTFLKDYTAKKLLGVGGFGCVFAAINKYDCGEYAVKRIAVDAKSVEKALNEVRTMVLLDHHNIVRYHNTWMEEPPVGWQGDSDVKLFQELGVSSEDLTTISSHSYLNDSVFIYIQMQLCHSSLAEWLDENQTAPSRNQSTIKSWFKQIVSGVNYIHEHNLIHRDLKPSNILFIRHDHLKLCDLGIAAERNDNEGFKTTISRTGVGSDLYMSPEQLSIFAVYSSKTDVFALGLILAELCVVMTHQNREEIFDSYRNGHQCDLVEDPDMFEFISSLTEIDPVNRPTCREILDKHYLA